MMNSTKKKPLRSKEKLEFKFELRATRIPQRGWDKLMVSLIAVETGKVTAKTGKALVKNGTCQWSDALYESTSFSQPINGKHGNKELYKLVVSMGTSRLGILGEATIDMAEYTQSLRPVSLSLPLQSCNFGTILHVKVQRLMANVVVNRDIEEQKEIPLEEASPQGHEVENDLKSSIATKDDFVPLTPGGSESRSHLSGWMADELISPSSSISSSHESSNFQYHVGLNNIDLKASASSDENPDEQVTNKWNNHETLDGLEKFEATIEEMRPDPVSTNENAVKISVDLNRLKKRLSDEIRKNEILEEKISTLSKDLVIEQGKFHAELENEKSLNSKLTLELRKTQENNSGLIIEIEELKKSLKAKAESDDYGNIIPEQYIRGLESENEALKNKLDVIEKDLKNSEELTLENTDLKSELQIEKQKGRMQAITVRQLENTIAELTSVVSQLEIKLATKYSENGKEQAKKVGETANGMTDNLRDCESSNEMHMASNEVDINSTERGFERETQDLDEQNAGFLTEIEMLKASFQHQILDFQNEIKLLKVENDGQKEEIQNFQQQTVHLVNEIKSLKRESDGHKSVITSQKGQLKRLRETSTKVEEEYMAVLKQLEELKVSSDASSRDDENFTALKKQLETTQEHLLSTESKYREMLQLTTCIDTEKSALLEVQKEAEATIAALQSVNASLQEDLRAEKLKNSGLQDQHDRDEDKLSVLIDEMTQLKLSEQEMVAQAKEMENKIRILQEENKNYRTRIEELETEIESDPASKTHLRGTMSELGIQKVRTLSELFKSQQIQLTRLDESFENETMENEKMDLEILCESEVKKKEPEQQGHLPLRIGHLEFATAELMKQYCNSNADQILKELESFRRQNAILSQREIKLLKKLLVLQTDLDDAKKEKQQLEDALSMFNAAASDDNSLERIATLELQLAEVVEANNMYKQQLQSAFSQQQNIHVAALQGLGSAEQVLGDLAELKRRNAALDDELRDMKERYLSMSLQFAQVEDEREQLVMTLRALQGARKLMHYKSANF